jgi:hypothetical protein
MTTQRPGVFLASALGLPVGFLDETSHEAGELVALLLGPVVSEVEKADPVVAADSLKALPASVGEGKAGIPVAAHDPADVTGVHSIGYGAASLRRIDPEPGGHLPEGGWLAGFAEAAVDGLRDHHPRPLNGLRRVIVAPGLRPS